MKVASYGNGCFRLIIPARFNEDGKRQAKYFKTKEEGVEMLDAVITKTAKGAYMAQGHDGKGNKLTTLMGEEKAMAAIKAGIAKQGW